MPELHLLTGAYALDALDDVERKAFERHLRTCATCVIELMEFRESAASLADRVAQTPPAELRARVMAEVRRTRQVSPGVRASLPRPSLRQVLASAAAAVILAGGAGLGGVAWQAHRTSNEAQVEAGRIAGVMTDPSRIEVVHGIAGGGRAAVVAADGQAVFAADQLPAARSGKDYQLWVIHDGKARSVGLLKVQDGKTKAVVSGVGLKDMVAVTVEPDGGSKQPTTDPIVGLTVA